MNFESFIQEITARVKAVVGEEAEVCVQEVRKNNNVRLHGLSIMRKGGNVSPTIYLDFFYERLKEGMEMEEIVSKLLAAYVRGLPRGRVDMDFFRDFEKVKDRIVYRLVNREKNRELLEEIPHVDFLDLAICFYYSYEHPQLGDGMILIRNGHMTMWGTSHQELMHLAEHNTPYLLQYELSSMEDALEGLLDEEQMTELREMQRESRKYLYVLSNKRHVQGAAAILYPGLLEEVAGHMGGSFYILPSSIHEVILLPEDGRSNGEQLHEMIAEINRSQLQEEEVLSDYAYRYDAAAGKVTEVR